MGVNKPRDKEVTREGTGSNKERSIPVRDIERTQCHTQRAVEKTENSQGRIEWSRLSRAEDGPRPKGPQHGANLQF